MWKHKKESKWLVRGGRKVRCYLCGKKILAKRDPFLFHAETGYYSHQSCFSESKTMGGNERRRAVKKIAVGAALATAIAAGAGKFISISSQSKGLNSPESDAQTILTSQGLILPSLTSDPANPVPGQMWYRSDAGVTAHFDAVQNRVVYSSEINDGNVNVTSKGIINGLSVLPNDGTGWFGPDTTLGATAPGQYGSPYTKTVGIQEAIVKANGTDTVYLIPGIFSPTASIQISISQTVIKSTTGFVFGGGMTPENAYIQCPANVDTFTISTQSFIIDGILFNGNNALSNTGDIAIHLYVGTEPLNGKILNCQFINNYIGIKNDTSEINPITGAAQSGQGYNLYYESNQYSCLYANKYFFNNNGSSHSIMEKFFNITSASGYGLFLQENVIHYLEGSLFVNPTAAALNVASNLFGAFTNYLINAYQNQSTPNPVLIAAGNLIFSACNIHNSTGGTTIINVINPPSTFNQSTYITDDKQTNEVTVNNTSTSGLFVITDPVYGKLNPPALTTNPPVSGTAYQNTNPYDIEIDLPVYATTAGTAGYVTVAKGSTSTPTAIGNQFVNGSTSSTSTDIIRLRVPAGWYYKFTESGVTFGTASVFVD